MRALLVFVSLTACGRIGIDERGLADARTDGATSDGVESDTAMLDAPIDMMVTLSCPADMTRLSPTSTTCIEIVDRGFKLWLDGKALCESLGRRYCADAEWLEACTSATGVVGMTGSYEWVAEEAGGVAQKRGSAGCDDASAHVITDPYEARCCGPMI